MTTKGNGKAFRWILDHKDHDGDCCLIWPFYRNPNGYGMLGHLGEQYWAHRVMCEKAHGPAPSQDHEAAHSCGNGHMGCAHPKHLSWKTRSENLLDCREHGTQARSRHGSKGYLTNEQVMAIRSLKGKKTQDEIALTFGVSPPTIRDIFLGRSHTRPPKINFYSPKEEAILRAEVAKGCNFIEIAKTLGKSHSSVSMKAYRLGIRSGKPCYRRTEADGQGALK